jgi:hypothetical protein
MRRCAAASIKRHLVPEETIRRAAPKEKAADAREQVVSLRDMQRWFDEG